MKYQGVVVLFNPDEKVEENIKSYIPYLDKLYIVDNTPNVDNSNRFNKIEKTEYIPLKENTGIAHALNVGAKRALEEKADWLLTMDQDSNFQSGSLEKMQGFLDEMKKNKYLPKIVGYEYNKIGLISPFHITERSKKEKPIGIERPLQVMTSGNLINLNAYKKIGGYKDWFFIDCVDFEYCLNLQKNGYGIVQLNFAKLNHNLGDIIEKKFMGRIAYADNHSAFRRYFITRNRHYLFDLYHDDFPDYCNYELKRTRKEMLKIWLYEKNKIKKTKAAYRGYRDYKRGKKGALDEK